MWKFFLLDNSDSLYAKKKKTSTFYTLQVVEDGYEFFAKRQLVTLFSAPNYCGEFDNAGGMMSVDETLMCSFQVCQPKITFSSFLFIRLLFSAILYDKIVFFLFSCAFSIYCNNDCIYRRRLHKLVKLVSDPLCIIDQIK